MCILLFMRTFITLSTTSWSQHFKSPHTVFLSKRQITNFGLQKSILVGRRTAGSRSTPLCYCVRTLVLNFFHSSFYHSIVSLNNSQMGGKKFTVNLHWRRKVAHLQKKKTKKNPQKTQPKMPLLRKKKKPKHYTTEVTQVRSDIYSI